MSGQIHKMTISREALLKAVAQIVTDQSVGMANMDCVAMNAVLVGQRAGGVTETFPLDTIEVELVKSAPAAPARKVGKLSLAAVDGVLVA
ncbi:hypothetical protein [Sphingomonas sp. ACRSK]|uniref:hypothetical protein n=1 Tax=Sphingomonas sp. ACRSK TaxID=2918213 RepID=UPI001EF64566|nr:hypothetical protein [Sphingomonas sp. ACRSK]MCG7348881.1 hypothetical protein [Sphingomonas sp. ACRSK]